MIERVACGLVEDSGEVAELTPTGAKTANTKSNIDFPNLFINLSPGKAVIARDCFV
jgi:hypothetical protein